jgi:demethylmenaquinone methyltransferase/2-methoxy-6-polyprenyl-1,4-benzoquinol methylase
VTRSRPVYRWFYDKVHSRWYDLVIRWFLWPFGGERSFRLEMMEPVELGAHERILDLCCGTGSSTFVIREKAGDSATVLGVDLSIGQLRRAHRKNRFANVRFVEADATAVPFRSGSFDSVVIPHALHEMPRETRISVLREARRLNDPPRLARRILLGLWLGYWLPYPLNFENPTRRDMVRRGVLTEMREAGFSRTSKISKFEGTMQIVFGRP